MPDCVTVAFDASDDDHAIVRPESVLPDASSVAAESCVVAPTVTEAVAGEIRTDATVGTVTVRFVCPVFPPALAMTETAPGATPVMTPALEIVAIEELLVDHVTVPVAIEAPF
jgi:hypothetical protein